MSAPDGHEPRDAAGGGEVGAEHSEGAATAGDPAPSAAVRVGFIGLGNIGAPMARRWLEWPGGLTVFDVVPEATERFARKGAEAAASPAELAAACGVVSIMVRDDAQVDTVMTAPDGVLAGAVPGTVVLIHSTVEPATPVRLAALAAERGVHLLDAPVSGGAMGAHEGTLAFMLGGPAEAVELVREPLGMLGTLVAHMGPVGAGTHAKIARNLISFAAMVAAGEAARLAEAAGVDLALLGEVVRHSDRVTGGPGSVMIRRETGPLAPDDGLHPIFAHARDLGEKDLTLAIGLGDALGVDTSVAQQALAALATALGVPHDPPATD